MAEGKGGSLGNIASAIGNAVIPETMNAYRERNAYAAASDPLRQLLAMSGIGAAPKPLAQEAQRKPFDLTTFGDNGATTQAMPSGPAPDQTSFKGLPSTSYNAPVGGNFTAEDAPYAVGNFLSRKSDLNNSAMGALMQAPSIQKLMGQNQVNRAIQEPLINALPPQYRDLARLDPKAAIEAAAKAVGPQEVAPGASIVQRGADGNYNTSYTAPIKPPEGLSENGQPIPGYLDLLTRKAAAAQTPEEKAKINAQIEEAKANTKKALANVDMMEGGNIPDEVMNGMADQYLAGDKSVFSQLGRGVQGSANIARLRTAIQTRGAAAGLSPAAIAAKLSEYSANTAGMRTAAQAGAKMDTLANEVTQFAQQALETSRKVNRTNFIPLTKAEQLIEGGSSDPDLADFVAANTSLVNTYSAVANRGTPTVSSQHHAYDMLSTAMGQPAYERVVNRLLRETAAAKASPGATMADIRKRIDAEDKTGAPAQTQPGAKPNGPATVQKWTRDATGKLVPAQ